MSRAMHLWRWACGLPEQPAGDRGFDADDLRKTEWSVEFERMMRCRLIVGAYRYGRLGARGKPPYDRVSAIVARVRRYEETGNVDLLADVANLALLEFVEGRHPRRHMASESHVETVGIVEEV